MTKGVRRRRVLVVTGSRAEFGLLRPVMDAVHKHKSLELRVAVAGEHLLAPAHTWKEVAKAYRIDAKVPMQRPRDRGRLDHAAACARGMSGFAAAYKKLKPEWVVVLGDRIEAFAAASAASIAGIAVCHIHGGDRAEGIADEAMRHAITKLSHLHCAATKLSAMRIAAMGEAPRGIHVTGSPAVDGLSGVPIMTTKEWKTFGSPRFIVLVHPSGYPPRLEMRLALEIGSWAARVDGISRVLFLAPNSDPGREFVLAGRAAIARGFPWIQTASHLPREKFLSLLKRLALGQNGKRCAIVGNSSAGLIEAASLGITAVNIGPRQDGRERSSNVLDVPVTLRRSDVLRIDVALDSAWRKRNKRLARQSHFGDGRAGPRIAALLAKTDPHDPALLRKRNSY